MELSSWESVGRGLEALARGLLPFVDRHMAAFRPDRDWLQVMTERALRDGRPARMNRSDPRLLLRVIDETPRAYAASLSKLELAFVKELREIANRWAHSESFTRGEASRALDTISHLLRAAGATGEAGQVDELLAALRRPAPGPGAATASDTTSGRIVREAAPTASTRSGAAGRTETVQQAVTDGTLEFRNHDEDYLAWVKAHPGGYVLNTGPQGGDARLHRATCATITKTPPFTSGSYIKVCSPSPSYLDQWVQSRTGKAPRRCGICLTMTTGPPSAGDRGDGEPTPEAAAPGRAKEGLRWRADGPSESMPEVRLWIGRHIPFDRLSSAQLAARAELRQRLRALESDAGEILEASYAGPRPANADVENLVLYNIDSAGGCFRAAARYGVRFEMAAEPSPELADTDFACSYRYRLTTPDSEPRSWRLARRLARFDEADLGRFPSARRLEQVWLALHRAQVETAEHHVSAGTPFAVFVSLRYARSATAVADPELVKALIDGTTAAFQGHGDQASLEEIARRIAATTAQPADTVARMLANPARAVLGRVDRLAYPRASGVQWNPGDHACLVGQVTCEPSTSDDWTLSGQIYELRPRWQHHPVGPGRQA